MPDDTKPLAVEAWKWIVLILFLAFASMLFHLKLNNFDNTTLAFIGVPAVLAAVLAISGTPVTLEGRYMKATTLGILLVGILAAEKFAFLLLLAPFLWLLAYFRAQSAVRHRRTAADRAPVISQSIASASVTATPPTTEPVPIQTADQAAQPAPPPSPQPVALTPQQESDRVRRKKLTLVGICLTFAVISIAGRLIYLHHLETTSLMFIGVPTVLAVLLALSVRPKSVMATVMTGVTFVLLLSSVLLGEGFICILMAAPIFYVAGAIIGAIWESARTKPSTTRL